MPTPIYHFTNIKNLPSILQRKGLIANSILRQKQIDYCDIAHAHIQDRRARKHVDCGVGGYLHDYVPFYFAPRSPMLYAISKGNVEGYQGGQDSVIYLVSEAEIIANNNLNFVFTDGHAVMFLSEFYENIQDLESKIDWDIMKAVYWNNNDRDNDRTRRRQAEFLVHQSCPWELIQEIGVKNHTVQLQVQQILQNFNLQIPIQVYSGWYY
jgi:hypothetical protein